MIPSAIVFLLRHQVTLRACLPLALCASVLGGNKVSGIPQFGAIAKPARVSIEETKNAAPLSESGAVSEVSAVL